MNIVLTGYRGTGKTTAGKLLSRKLKMEFIDTDAEVEKMAKMRIPEIVGKHGWEQHRKFEMFAINGALKRKNTVTATGAGALVENKIREKSLKKNATVILLTATVKAISSRIKKSDRPSLTGKGTEKEIKGMLRRREKKYLELADVVVDTTDISPEETANMIISFLNTKQR